MADVHQDRKFIIKFSLQLANVRFSGWDWHTVGLLDAHILLPVTDSLEKASRPFCLGHWLALLGTPGKVLWHMEPGRVSHFPGVFSTKTALGPILPKEKGTETPLPFCWVCEPSDNGNKGSYSVGMETPNLVLPEASGLGPLRKGVPLPWTVSQQPLIKSQHCTVWHSLLTGLLHLETAILQDLGWSQHNPGGFFACKEGVDPKCCLLLCYLNTTTVVKLHGNQGVKASRSVTESSRLFVLTNPAVQKKESWDLHKKYKMKLIHPNWFS